MSDAVAEWCGALNEASEIVWSSQLVAIAPGPAPAVAAQFMSLRVSRLLRAVAALVEAGFVPEASGLVRSIWEDAASAAYMAEKPEERAERWIDFADTRRTHHLLRDSQNPRLNSDVARRLLEDVEDPQLCAADWAGTSASGLANNLKVSKDPNRALLGHDFEVYYQTLCDDTHGSPFAMAQLVTGEGPSAEVTVGPDYRRVSEIPALALYGAYQFTLACEVLGAPSDTGRLRELVDVAGVRQPRSS